MDNPRLIEVAFPLRQASLDSVHEKNIRHGHISTLHIWPARRPLAACRAALLATLLPDPGTEEGRRELLEKIGGHVVRHVETKQQGGKTVEVIKEETEGGVLHWGRENSPDMDWFREQIRKAYGGRAPRVLDPFAGGGAIPLEAMRLGCEATAIDINPVAWFILKCTLEYPQKLAGQVRPLPAFARQSREFMAAFLKGRGVKGKRLDKELNSLQLGLFPPPDVDLAWHVRAWGWWVLQQARAELERIYPVVDGKPTVAYLWARTVSCKNCRAVVPLLKTRWLCKKNNKRVVLTMEPNGERTGVLFGVRDKVPVVGGNAAQKKEHDKKFGGGTMSRSGARCPCCGTIMTMEDIRLEGRAGRLSSVMTAVVVDGEDGKMYRLPIEDERRFADEANAELEPMFAPIPFGLPNEPFPTQKRHRAVGSQLPGYGFLTWRHLFLPRQLLSMGQFVKLTRRCCANLEANGYSAEWRQAIVGYLALMFDRLVNQSSNISRWNMGGENIEGTFARFAFPMLWDFAEVNPLAETSGGYPSALEWVSLAVEHLLDATQHAPISHACCHSALQGADANYDFVLTDPPYYDAIPYADLMDFFYVWLRRTLNGHDAEIDEAFRFPLSPKWDREAKDGELIDDPGGNGGDRQLSKVAYEDGMFRVFAASNHSLRPDGRLVVVFAHKQPDAWETLASAIIRAGFVVDGSWPIQTERAVRANALNAAALASSVWLVCKKRSPSARPGWDNRVLEEMRSNIHQRLTDYWNAGIRGPDFVWAATGPALEAYSKHPVVKKATEPGQTLSVAEFLREVRRLVVNYVVGRVLVRDGEQPSVLGLDDLTTYYLLHRHDFALGDAPIGACILYAVSCNLSDAALCDRHDLLARTGGKASTENEDEDTDADADDTDTEEAGSGSKVKLKAWSQRKRKTLGENVEGRPAALIDQVHRLMHLWKSGDVIKVDEYLNDKGLRRFVLFHQLLQALIELAPAGSEERSLLESISNHVAARGMAKPEAPGLFDSELFGTEED